ncbi:hypothetical protein [Hymenobacter coccineus]|uniref:hypothetical protein n=1 Tax=Hymenobacter coccineus TaxID=1908235 RepID=UPI000F784C79|nr:hypothetical protein [Hymenobacter coccineus]
MPVERAVGAHVADALREALRERRQVLKIEAAQLRRDGGENAYRRGPAPPAPAAPSGLAPPPDGARAAQS